MGRVKRGAMLLVKIVATLAITVGLAEAASYIMYERLAHRPFSMERIQAELGWSPDIPLDQTLDDLLNDWRARSKA